MHVTIPVACRRRVYWHKSSEERVLIATETKQYFETRLGEGQCNMWMDSMDEQLEAKYKTRPWRQCVIEAETRRYRAKRGLALFNTVGNIKAIEDATATEDIPTFPAKQFVLAATNPQL